MCPPLKGNVVLTPRRVDFFGLNDGLMEGVDLNMYWQKDVQR